MPGTLAFYHPRSLDEAVGLLEDLGDEAKVVAGSTAVTLLLRQRLIAPSALVDIGRLPGLDTIAIEDGALVLGALVRHRDVERSPLVREQLPVVADVFSRVANVRVRNAATVGGVLAESDYASDPPAVFVALDAVIQAHGPGGAREIPASEFFVAFYETALEPTEIVTGIRVPLLAPGTGEASEKHVTRSSEDRPCVGVAGVVRLAADGTVEDLRASVGAAAETPQRFPDVERGTIGRPFDEDLARAVADQYAERIDPLDDMRGSAWYRTEMVRVWVRRTLERAAEQARTATGGGR